MKTAFRTRIAIPVEDLDTSRAKLEASGCRIIAVDIEDDGESVLAATVQMPDPSDVLYMLSESLPDVRWLLRTYREAPNGAGHYSFSDQDNESAQLRMSADSLADRIASGRASLVRFT